MIVVQLTIDLASSSTLVGRKAEVNIGDIGTVGTIIDANKITIINHGTAGSAGDAHCFPFCKKILSNIKGVILYWEGYKRWYLEDVILNVEGVTLHVEGRIGAINTQEGSSAPTGFKHKTKKCNYRPFRFLPNIRLNMEGTSTLYGEGVIFCVEGVILHVEGTNIGPINN